MLLNKKITPPAKKKNPQNKGISVIFTLMFRIIVIRFKVGNVYLFLKTLEVIHIVQILCALIQLFFFF